MKRAEAFLDILGSLLRRVVPADEELIRRNIAENLPEMVRRSEVTGGFSFNPRTADFRQGGEEAGYMMATVPERPGLNRVMPTEEEVLRLISDPYYMERLQRGQYLGGWMDEDQLVLDPAQRFLNKDRSIVLGARAGQQGGFDLYGQQDFNPVTGDPIELLIPPGGMQRSGAFYPTTDPMVVEEAARQEALRKLRRVFGAGAAGFAGADLLSRRD